MASSCRFGGPVGHGRSTAVLVATRLPNSGLLLPRYVREHSKLKLASELFVDVRSRVISGRRPYILLAIAFMLKDIDEKVRCLAHEHRSGCSQAVIHSLFLHCPRWLWMLIYKKLISLPT